MDIVSGVSGIQDELPKGLYLKVVNPDLATLLLRLILSGCWFALSKVAPQ